MRELNACLKAGIRAGALMCAAAWLVGGVAFAQAPGPKLAGECTAASTKAAPGCAALREQVTALVAAPAVVRAHWGIDVVALDGTPIYALNESQYFHPASNAKLFTTAVALALLGSETRFTTRVVAEGEVDADGILHGDLVLVGDGDANLSGREIPYVSPALRPKLAPGATPPPEPDPLRYIAELADQVAKSGIKKVTGNVLGDSSLFPWEPYPEDWAIDDMVWGYGAPVSALTLNDNQIKLTIAPGATERARATTTLDPAFPVEIYQMSWGPGTGKKGSTTQIDVSREVGSKQLAVSGTIAVGAQPDVEEVAISNPDGVAAAVLKALLVARGVVITGPAGTKRTPMFGPRSFITETHEPVEDLNYGSLAHERLELGTCIRPAECPAAKIAVVATHQSPTLAEDVVVTNKVSQNLHAELLLHQLAVSYGNSGSTWQGVRVVRAFLTTKVGIDPDDFVFFDGSGLSGHDLVTPRATAKLLQYATRQPWFADWKRSLPVGGVDGSLEQRFAKPPLAGHVFAKTGTLGEARALSGYIECASGKTVIFSIMVDNHAPRDHADRDAMDKIVAAIAANN